MNPITLSVNVVNENVNIDTEVDVHVAPVTDYNILSNKPRLNGIELVDNLSLSHIHKQTVASDVWIISHELNKYPSVTVVDTAGSVIVGEVYYIDKSTVRVQFTSFFSGTAYLN